MSSLTRSASLTNLISSQKNRQNDYDDGEFDRDDRDDDSRYSSPQRRIQQPLRQQQQQRSLNVIGASTGKPLKTWNWLGTAKSFHGTPPSPTRQHNSGVLYDPINAKRLIYQHQYQMNYEERRKVARVRYMDHLETLLPKYCSFLSHPTYQNCACAMSLLLNDPPPAPPVSLRASETPPASPEKRSRQGFLIQQQKKESEAKSTVKSEMNRLLSSPFRARKRRQNPIEKSGHTRWGSSSSPNDSFGTTENSTEDRSSKRADNTNKLDEMAWQEFCTPLILLAGAEAVYADLEHVHSGPNIIRWSGLYGRVSSDLKALLAIAEEIPVTSKSEPQPTPDAKPREPSEAAPADEHSPIIILPPKIQTESPQFSHKRASVAISPPTSPSIEINQIATIASEPVSSKYAGLQSLCNWLEFKCQWIPFHESLYLTWSGENLMFIRAFSSAQASLSTSPSDDTDGEDENDLASPSRPLVEALQQEIQATQSLLEMAFCLERGR